MAATYPQLVLFGDSLLQNSIDVQDGFSFQAELQSRLIRRLDVVNRGFAGWNTKYALQYLPSIFPKPTSSSPKLEYLVILLGANDAIVPHSHSTRNVPVDQYKDNLTTIINHEHIRAHSPKIFLVTPPPVDEEKVKSLGNEPRTVAHTALYAEAVREIAEENSDIILVDLWDVITKASLASPEKNFNHLFVDGLHLNGEGYRLFYDLIQPLISGLDSTQYIYPDWKDLAE
ncbi:GDSL lipase acylhydrolase family [Fusarium beomiforme]|uniref:GDSL lipase acylhydrolase family n=1 Tax=Fusarium beomiforme TaxID=44412 RepID=A0A9P5APB5_9HYPO|nr:GDSL lipase acylhydrolase family [Fusarium beomiforme]